MYSSLHRTAYASLRRISDKNEVMMQITVHGTPTPLEGKKVEIYEYQSEKGSGKLYVNSVSRLPIYAEFTDSYQGHQGNIQFYFEFPESGPKDIYDLGVPNDAPIIEN